MSRIPFIEARFFSETEGRFELETRFKKHLRKLRCRRIPPNLLAPPDEVDAPDESPDIDLAESIGIASGSGAGGVVRDHEATLPAPAERDGLPVTASRQVPAAWTDYNGHMNETHYLEAASAATDRFMEMIGADAAYVAAGKSYFTVENHIRYLEEVHAGDRLTITTQVLEGAGKRLHLFHRLWRDDILAATIETLLLHTDLKARASSAPDRAVAEALAAWAARHDGRDVDGAGRFVGQRSVSAS